MVEELALRSMIPPNVIAGGGSDQILITDFFSGVTGFYGTCICQIDGENITIAQASDGAPGGLETLFTRFRVQ